jgi:hypothetical protein
MAFKLKSSGSSPFLETTNRAQAMRDKQAKERELSSFIKRPESPKKVNRATNTDWLNSETKPKQNTLPLNSVPPPPPTKPVITGKIGSDLRRQQYKTAGYKADDTVKKARSKVKAVEPIKAKSVKAVATKSGATKKPIAKSATSRVSEKKAPKLAARRVSASKVSKNDARKTRKIKKKLSQAAEARAGGNEKKALRKEKAAMRKASRLSKK